jgi:hypothetical protein
MSVGSCGTGSFPARIFTLQAKYPESVTEISLFDAHFNRLELLCFGQAREWARPLPIIARTELKE